MRHQACTQCGRSRHIEDLFNDGDFVGDFSDGSGSDDGDNEGVMMVVLRTNYACK